MRRAPVQSLVGGTAVRVILCVPGHTSGLRLASYVQFALTESKEPRMGGQCVLGRLSELMFVDVIRHYLEVHFPAQIGPAGLPACARSVCRPRAVGVPSKSNVRLDH